MTDNMSRKSYKLEDLPLTESVEGTDTLSDQRKFLNIDDLTYDNSNIGFDQQPDFTIVTRAGGIYPNYTNSSAHNDIQNHPGVQNQYANANSYNYHSAQPEVGSTTEPIGNTKSLQSLDQTAEVHNYSILQEATTADNPNSIPQMVVTKLFSEPPRVKMTKEFEIEDDSNDTNLDQYTDVQRAYKNYEITHDQIEIQTESGLFASGAVDDPELMNDDQLNANEGDSEKLKQEDTKEVQRRALLKNPGIGSLISESSKQIDKINKMLEAHRKKKSHKMSNQLIDNLESGNSENPFDPQTSSNTEIIHEDHLSLPESSSKFADSRGNALSKGGDLALLQERASGSSNGASEDSLPLGGKIKVTAGRPRDIIDSSGQVSLDNLVENMITAREESEAGFRNDDGVLEKLGDEIHAQEAAFNVRSRDLKDGKKLNKIQMDYAKYQAETNQQRHQRPLQELNKVNNKQEKGQRSKRSKERCPVNKRRELDKRVAQKDDTAHFFSVDGPHSTKGVDHRLKSKPSANKGSYLKKFLEHKEKRRTQGHNNQNNGALTSKSQNQHSGSSDRSNRSNDKFSPGHSKEVIQTIGSSIGVDSGDYNLRSDRSVAKERCSAPKPYARGGFMNDVSDDDSAEKKPENMKLMRYNEFRDAHRNSKKEPVVNPLEQQLNKLDLNYINGEQAQDGEQINLDDVISGTNHSVSVGLSNLDPPTSRVPTSRNQPLNTDKFGDENINYEQEFQSAEVQNGGTGSSCSTSGGVTCKVTHESLLKSLKLRQEIYSRAFKKPKHLDGQILGERKDGGSANAALMKKKQQEEERSMYNKNVKWLMSKQRKLDEMHHREIEQEMKECTFKPHLVTKELNLKQDVNISEYVTRARVAEPISRVLIVEQR